MHLTSLFIKLRDRMFIKKKNVSSKLKETVNHTNCFQLLCWKWGDSVGRVFEWHSGGQNSLQGPVLMYCTAVVSVAATHVKRCLDITKRTVGTPFICVSLDTDPGWHTEDPWVFSPHSLCNSKSSQPCASSGSPLSLRSCLNIPVQHDSLEHLIW